MEFIPNSTADPAIIQASLHLEEIAILRHHLRALSAYFLCAILLWSLEPKSKAVSGSPASETFAFGLTGPTPEPMPLPSRLLQFRAGSVAKRNRFLHQRQIQTPILFSPSDKSRE